MPYQRQLPAWWGPPRAFDKPSGDRRISWLELFYDLVYVMAISRITRLLTLRMGIPGLIEYGCLFLLIFWGWLNGSLYYDFHGNEGLRTRLMMLWQMMIVAALSVTVGHLYDHGYQPATITLLVMQLFITYLWWSVGIYDRRHRRLNLPYTICYLCAGALMAVSLLLQPSWLAILVPAVLLCNYLPPLISQTLLQRSRLTADLSSSMYERLGLFMMIVFGEVVAGAVNGLGVLSQAGAVSWLSFALMIVIVFALWWIFFTLTANRQAKKGFYRATLLELLYIPALMALGLIAVCFSRYFGPGAELSLTLLFTTALAAYFIAICLMMGQIEYPREVQPVMLPVRASLLVTAIVFPAAGTLLAGYPVFGVLLTVWIILAGEILFLNIIYYRLAAKPPDLPPDANPG